MKIHEYQGKELLKKVWRAVPRGIVARSPEEAYHAAKEFGTDDRGGQSADSCGRSRQGRRREAGQEC